MRRLIMVRYGEIYLKGQNRPFFLKLLIRRVRNAVKPFHASVLLSDSRLIVSGMTDIHACMERIRKVFGVHSVCPAIEMDKADFEDVCAQAAAMMQDMTGTFRVTARRSDKLYPLNSPQISARIGAWIIRANDGLRVDLRMPDHVLHVEIRDHAYLYVDVLPGVGGMPVGSNGKATLLLSGGIDSPVAGYMIAKRGVQISAVHFHSFPYTGERSREKVLQLARILSDYCCGIRVYVVPFTTIQTMIYEKCPEDYTTLIMRRYMMRIADRIATAEKSQALITGESIGQVASQTMEALACTDVIASRPVFRPLIGMDKSEIVDLAKAIGTYETSCLPYEDCCTVFTPRHPVTRPRLPRVVLAEKGMADAADAFVHEAVATAEIIDL
ncbi:MAG: tRNA 4-thiouridine(8) synthase ThiI [Clostridiales bacterium]|nr:tRNA 4-thiouridine(8) synthase ThiI [Clostridiales bacterium]